MIELHDVSVAVPVWGDGGRQRTKQLLAGVSASLAEQRVAVIGANGSGKSTLLRLLNGLITASSGRVLVDGIDPARDGKGARQRVGFVFTDPLSQLVMSTPADDIELSLRKRIRDRRERAARAQAILDERGLGDVAHQSIYDLSGGERQLVSLATVLAIEPAIVVADEPTTLLDLRNRMEVCEALLGLPQQLLYATHDLDFAAQADRALVIHEGRLSFDGSAAEAISHYRGLMASGTRASGTRASGARVVGGA
ncbi:energy-coupling factor ABC transporter ATP-binding protein [Actinomycetota bacterium]